MQPESRYPGSRVLPSTRRNASSPVNYMITPSSHRCMDPAFIFLLWKRM
ncbi:hypothetical protein X975_16384, partial [Stegodyphus mimosarum]